MIIKINNFRAELTDNSAKKEAPQKFWGDLTDILAETLIALLQVKPMGTTPATLEIKYTDQKVEVIDITDMHGQQVFDFIHRRIEERATADVLAKHKFGGTKLTSAWGL